MKKDDTKVKITFIKIIRKNYFYIITNNCCICGYYAI